MSASDHLSAPQFGPSAKYMAMEKILSLASGDVREGERTVADVLPRKLDEINNPVRGTERYWPALRRSMEERGQTAPVEVVRTSQGRVMGEGHHRVAIAHDLGWQGMWVHETRAKYGKEPVTYADPEFFPRYIQGQSDGS